VISGVIVHEDDWFLLDRDFKNIKSKPKYQLKGEIKSVSSGQRTATRITPWHI
jgi:hypothetical protein